MRSISIGGVTAGWRIVKIRRVVVPTGMTPFSSSTGIAQITDVSTRGSAFLVAKAIFLSWRMDTGQVKCR